MVDTYFYAILTKVADKKFGLGETQTLFDKMCHTVNKRNKSSTSTSARVSVVYVSLSMRSKILLQTNFVASLASTHFFGTRYLRRSSVLIVNVYK